MKAEIIVRTLFVQFTDESGNLIREDRLALPSDNPLVLTGAAGQRALARVTSADPEVPRRTPRKTTGTTIKIDRAHIHDIPDVQLKWLEDGELCERDDKIMAMLDQGMSGAAIAKSLDMKVGNVYGKIEGAKKRDALRKKIAATNPTINVGPSADRETSEADDSSDVREIPGAPPVPAAIVNAIKAAANETSTQAATTPVSK